VSSTTFPYSLSLLRRLVMQTTEWWDRRLSDLGGGISLQISEFRRRSRVTNSESWNTSTSAL